MKNFEERKMFKCFYYSFAEFKSLVNSLCAVDVHIEYSDNEPVVLYGENNGVRDIDLANAVRDIDLALDSLCDYFDCFITEVIVVDKENVLLIVFDNEEDKQDNDKLNQLLLNVARLKPESKGVFYKDGYEQAKKDCIRVICNK